MSRLSFGFRKKQDSAVTRVTDKVVNSTNNSFRKPHTPVLSLPKNSPRPLILTASGPKATLSVLIVSFLKGFRPATHMMDSPWKVRLRRKLLWTIDSVDVLTVTPSGNVISISAGGYPRSATVQPGTTVKFTCQSMPLGNFFFSNLKKLSAKSSTNMAHTFTSCQEWR